MKKIIATTMLLGSMSAFAGPYSIKFSKPLVLKGSSLISVDKVENKANSDGAWTEKVTNVEKQNCEFSINIEGRDKAVENRGIGEHYYGNMTVSCERAGFSASAFKTNFSRVLLLGIRECVMSETVIDNDYCELKVLALRKETDMNTQNGDLISDKTDSRKFYRIHSNIARSEMDSKKFLPNGVNPSLIDSYQMFSLSIGRNGNEFFIPSKNGASSFVSGRNIFLKVTEAALSRDAELRNTIELSLKELEGEVEAISSATKPGEVFKQKFSGILGKFSTTVQKLLGIISPVEFFQLEKQLKEFESNLITTAKIYNPNVTSRDSFRSNYGTEAVSLTVMMDYLSSQSQNDKYSSIANIPEAEQGLKRIKGASQVDFEYRLTSYYSEDVNNYGPTLNFYDNYANQLSFSQFKMMINIMKIEKAKNEIIGKYYYRYHSYMILSDFEELKSLISREAKNYREYDGMIYSNLGDYTLNEITKHWKVVHGIK